LFWKLKFYCALFFCRCTVCLFDQSAIVDQVMIGLQSFQHELLSVRKLFSFHTFELKTFAEPFRWAET